MTFLLCLSLLLRHRKLKLFVEDSPFVAEAGRNIDIAAKDTTYPTTALCTLATYYDPEALPSSTLTDTSTTFTDHSTEPTIPSPYQPQSLSLLLTALII